MQNGKLFFLTPVSTPQGDFLDNFPQGDFLNSLNKGSFIMVFMRNPTKGPQDFARPFQENAATSQYVECP